MFLADQLDNPNAVILSNFKNYLFKAEEVKNKTKQNKIQFSLFLTLPSSFTHTHAPKKHTCGWQAGTDTLATHRCERNITNEGQLYSTGDSAFCDSPYGKNVSKESRCTYRHITDSLRGTATTETIL